MMPVNRMNNGHVELTQGVSQMSLYSARPVSEELFDTSIMTIEDLIRRDRYCTYLISIYCIMYFLVSAVNN